MLVWVIQDYKQEPVLVDVPALAFTDKKYDKVYSSYNCLASLSIWFASSGMVASWIDWLFDHVIVKYTWEVEVPINALLQGDIAI